jgi:uncharacterized protein
MLRVGLISDTHGLLRPEAERCLQGCDHIIHAGDIGKPEVLDRLAVLGPVTAIKGNVDKGDWAARLPWNDYVQIQGVFIHVLHDISELDIDPVAAEVNVVVSGHSHVPKIAERGGILFVNPGSAGPRRFKLPVSLAELRITGSRVEVKIVELNIKPTQS